MLMTPLQCLLQLLSACPSVTQAAASCSSLIVPFPPVAPLCTPPPLPQSWRVLPGVWGHFPLLPLMHRTLIILLNSHPMVVPPSSSVFASNSSISLFWSILSLVSCHTKILQPLPAIWGLVLFPCCPIPRCSLCHCIAFSCKDLPYPSPFIFFQLFLPHLLQMALSHLLSHCCCLSLGYGTLLLPAPKRRDVSALLRCAGRLRMSGKWSCSYFGNISFSIWLKNCISVSEQGGTASWILSTHWKLGKEQSAVLPFCCLICFGFLYLCYSVWKEEAVLCKSLQHPVIFTYLKDCAVLCCLCALTLQFNFSSLLTPGAIP